MDYEYLLALKKHPSWKLMSVPSGPFIIAFLYRAFMVGNHRSRSQAELVAELEDFQFFHRQSRDEDFFPRKAQVYLDEWADVGNGYLRKYYTSSSDEPEYDMTPAVEKVFEWVQTLEHRNFIGTESRLRLIFELLREMGRSTESDPKLRIAQLESEKRHLEREIERLKNGHVVPYDSTRVKEQFFQVQDMARKLISDFRQVEANFLELDKKTRQEIATSADGKGDILDTVFGEQDLIQNSDQGRSFRAFWQFLMSTDHQEEIHKLIHGIIQLPEITNIEKSEELVSFKFDLMEAGQKVQKTSAILVEQLRKFLDDRIWLENRRITDLIHEIEKNAVLIRDDPPRERVFYEIDSLKVDISIPMERGLFLPELKTVIKDVELEEGVIDFTHDYLFQTYFIDETRLRHNLRECLLEHDQITLAEVLKRFPLEKGLHELVTYLDLGSKMPRSMVDEGKTDEICWTHEHGILKRARIPRVIFVR